jgi:hypothetical protein
VTAPIHAPAADTPQLVSSRIVPMPAAAQCTAGKTRSATGNGTRDSRIRTGYIAPTFGFGISGRPPEISGVHTGSSPADHAA